MKKDLVHKSKLLSLALRHEPGKFNLTLNKEGWTDLKNLLRNIKQISLDDIKDIIKESEKKRFELDEVSNRIRAYYGHSVEKKIEKPSEQPPEILYHATSHEAYKGILKIGLMPMGRQYVHLTTDIPNAISNGRRKDRIPVLLEIEAGIAFKLGVKFYKGNDDIWLSDPIPTNYFKRVHYEV